MSNQTGSGSVIDQVVAVEELAPGAAVDLRLLLGGRQQQGALAAVDRLDVDGLLDAAPRSSCACTSALE